ncbi:MAG: site-specific integrase [Acidobacteria bacterium]|nr:site-specific integrase [Acidobacteriota bacterium]
MSCKKHLIKEAKNIYSHTDASGKKTYYIRYKHMGQEHWEAVDHTLTLAKKALAIRKAEIAQGKWGIHKVNSYTMDELAEKYREYIQANNLLGHNYESLIKNVLSFFSGKRVGEITPFFIEKYKLFRQKAKRILYKGTCREEATRPVRPASVNRELSVLSKMLTIAVQEKWISINPVKSVPRLREDNHLERVLTREEEDRLLAACAAIKKAPHLRAIVVIAIYMGCRLSEILRLKWEQVDLNHNWITLIKTKNGRVRRVDINSKLRKVFVKLFEQANSEFIFPSKLRKDKNLGCVKKGFHSVCRQAEIQGIRFHDLRHTWASRMLEKGNSPAVVRDLGGWSDLSILNRYAHSTPEARKRAVESLVSDAEPEASRESKREQSVNAKVVDKRENHKVLKTKWAHQGLNLGPTDYELVST